MPTKIDLKSLLEAGVHFGHKTSRWHPKMAPYIHSKRQDIHIIDLVQTAEKLAAALDFIERTVAEGKQILLVGTKRQARDLVQRTAQAVKQPYVAERWMGGTLTNSQTINERIKHLRSLELRMSSGELANRYSKLEVQRFQEEIDHLNAKYGGIKEMSGRPGAMFVVDIVAEANAVAEARRLSIPVVAMVDTNADPSLVDYPIPANDDSIKSIDLMLNHVARAIESGVAAHQRKAQAQTAASEARS
ncbi:MAG: 30S ribosomal protein S2 [Candidatus Chaera renei]|uniref:Small ribosomal subunit protein uS2 n=1 Tax=Candidatus Chaera renei TaxID=2506947 RepID=A0A4V1J7K2_9BACT|nr:MAG: 30S ribosomal protein S2 [Candidatus Chaera renei]